MRVPLRDIVETKLLLVEAIAKTDAAAQERPDKARSVSTAGRPPADPYGNRATSRRGDPMGRPE